ncbi:mitochondrial-processing peptidase subunit beta [Phakopsora pachyrhizi]|uniref:mitochondrial processing peptidase n=1 Tax=Phakopsora pachyrhizi TaxID=170000 RepID=A0AAV0BXI4_PHAPC|nr:mitochondrial-processing peptidase subunit beta [Phakopsora pachyrhizi]
MSMSRVFLRSRGLAGNIKRNSASPKISLRSLATAINSSSLPQTRLSTLPNGLTVATEAHPHSQTATVGIWIDSGSRADKHGGTAHFLEHLAFKGTQKRTQHSLELEIENLGAHLNAYTSREQTCYFARSFSSDVPQMVEIISDILQNSKLDEGAIDRERSAHEEVVFDHLHAIAFQDEGLGKTILGPKESILSIQRPDLVEYIKSNYTADRMVLVGAGGLEHEVLVQLAEKNFGKVPNIVLSHTSWWQGKFQTNRLHRCRMELTDLFPMLVMQSIFGNWDRSLGSSPLMSSRLSHTLSSNNLVNSFLSFSTSYSDTGLWGIYLVSENLTNIDDLVFFTLREWQRMSTAPTEIEVARAKSQLKASMLFSLDSSNNIADDIGRQLVTSGRRMTPQEIQAAVEAKYLWDKDIAVAALGRTEGLLDYNRIRSNMSSLTW